MWKRCFVLCPGWLCLLYMFECCWKIICVIWHAVYNMSTINMCKLFKKTWNGDQAMSIFSKGKKNIDMVEKLPFKKISNNHQDFKTLHCGPRRKHGVMACYCSLLIVSPYHHHSVCHSPRKLHYSILWAYTRLSSHRENKLQLSIYSF